MPSAAGNSTSERSAIWVGCSGWAYPSWRPDFYPAKTPQKKLLEAYAARLNSVEVNYTFRSLPGVSTLENWLHATPEHFRFSFKAPQRISHFERLRNSAATLASFAECIAPVRAAGRLGVLLVQLPPTLEADRELLNTFLDQASSTGMRYAFEFRHASWFGEAIYTTLEQHGAALCVAASDELETPDRVTAPFACYRLRRSHYSPDELAAVRQKLTARAADGEVFAYFKHEDEPTGPLRAAAVLEGLPA